VPRALEMMTGAAIAIGIANIVTSAVIRRSRTRRRLVDPPLMGSAEVWLGRARSEMECLPVTLDASEHRYSPATGYGKELGGTARVGTYGSVRPG
jgi:hypothetical protein